MQKCLHKSFSLFVLKALARVTTWRRVRHRSPKTLPSIRRLVPRLQTPKQVPVPTQVRVGGFSPMSQQGMTMGGCKHWSQMYPSPFIPGSKSCNQQLCHLCGVFHWEHENPRVQECRNVKCYQSPAAHKEQRRPINATICVIPEWASLQHTKAETSNKCNYLCCLRLGQSPAAHTNRDVQ